MSALRAFTLELCVAVLVAPAFAQETAFHVSLRSRAAEQDGSLRVTTDSQTWQPRQTAVIVCDMWDSHHCLNAVRRVKELAPRIDDLLNKARSAGATIIHAPSSCLEFYQDHPARRQTRAVPRAAHLPPHIESWCDWINETEKTAGYPIDHSDGGEDDDLEEHQRWHEQLKAIGRTPGSPWIRQIDRINIHATDYITDDGVENWSILEHRGIKNVMIVGVHTNMCVLGRPFGLRHMSRNGKNVVLVRDLTDTMYNPAMPPHVNHFSGTDLVIEHVEQYVCPTLTSDQLLGGVPLRFRNDRRPHIVVLIGEDEYETHVTLPKFARQHLYRDFRVSFVFADPRDIHRFPGIEVIKDADLLVVSVRRRSLPDEQLQIVRDFVAAGKPIVGIRTASHAFALRDGQQLPPGHSVWPEFDAEVLGGNYVGHHGNKGDADEKSYVWVAGDGWQSPLLGRNSGQTAVYANGESVTTSWLYKTSPLKPGTRVLMMGRVGNRQPHEPVTWTFIHNGGGRTFYTSLGHPADFAQADFQRLLTNGIYWALDRQNPSSVAASKKFATANGLEVASGD